MTATTHTETRHVGDAVAHGRIDSALLSRLLALGFGDNKSAKYWPTWRGSFYDLLTRLSIFETGPKDAKAFLQGYLRENADGRKAAEMAANYIMMLDLETGAPIAELVARVKASGLLAVIYTTHSHLTTVTEISRDELVRWMSVNGRGSGEPTEADAVAFLQDKKKVRPEILAGAALGQASDPDKRVVLRHKPMPRARILLLLDTPYEFTDDASRQRWKDIYAAVARMLGVVYDPSCSDPSRLMYTPRIASEADRVRHEIHVIPGKALDLTKVPVETAVDRAKSAGVTKTSTARAGAGDPHKFATESMPKFMRICAGSFRASDWLKAQDPKGVRYPYQNEPKHDHECPRENCHTEPTDNDRAFMVRNAVPNGNGFGMSCRHAGCIAFAQRPDGKEDRARYLDLLCEQRGITDAAELLEWCDDEARAEWAGGRGFDLLQERPLLLVADHIATARKFVECCWTVDGLPTIRRYRGEWHVYDGQRYAPKSSEDIQGDVLYFLARCDRIDKDQKRVPVHPNLTHVANVIMALQAEVRLDETVEAPAWVGSPEEGRPPASEMLACANGLVHLKTRELWAHTPAFFSPNCLPYGYNPQAPEPKMFIAFLDQIFGSEQEQIRTLQMWFYLLLTGDRRHQKILYLEGPTRSGRGTLLAIMEALLGEANVVGMQLANLVKDNGLASLIGKKAAVFGDVHLEDIKSSSNLVELLLSLSAGDKITVRRKYRDDWTGVLPALLTMASNAPLRLKNASGALPGRFVALQTRRSFLGCEDINLKTKLLAELPGILLWALQGRTQFLWQGFGQPKESAGVIEAMRDGAMPLHRYIRERLNTGPDLRAGHNDIFADYTQWAIRNGLSPDGKAEFGRQLHAAVRAVAGITLKDARPRKGDDRDRDYVGIALKS